MSFGIVASKYRRKGSGQPTTIDGHSLNFRKGNDYYVDASKAGQGDGSSWEAAFNTMAAAFAKIGSGDTIYVTGKVNEQLTAPVQVFDVRIIGISNKPRHADSTPAGGNTHTANWSGAGLTAATANLRLLQQGWIIENILFNMVDSNAAGIEICRNAASGDSERDASHTQVRGCKFAGAGVGIRCGVAGTFTEIPNHVRIEDNIFIDNTFAIRGAIQGQRWSIRDNEFQANTNHIVCPLGASFIYRNIFGAFTTDAIELPGGQGLNIVTMNYLSGTYSSAGGYTVANANDEWAGNFNTLSGGITVVDPA